MSFLVGGNPSKIIGNKTTPHSTSDPSTLGVSTLDIMDKLPYELAKHQTKSTRQAGRLSQTDLRPLRLSTPISSPSFSAALPSFPTLFHKGKVMMKKVCVFQRLFLLRSNPSPDRRAGPRVHDQ
jgi:hypothetical protein